MNFISLFSGIGGFDLGFEQAEMACVLQVENDRAARDVLQRRWPDVPKIKDVRDVNRNNAPATDLICGGFPCQDLSIAGKRQGLAGERSGLWFEFHRIIKELKPRWAIIENVPGLLSSESGRDFAVILRGLAECGYYAAWRVLDAQYFGVAQRRRRVFIVASLGNGSCAQVLFESEGSAWDSPPGRETGQRVAGTIEGSPVGTFQNTGHGWWNESQVGQSVRTPEGGGSLEANLVAYGGNNTQGSIKVATAVDAGHGSRRYDFESETFITATLNSGGNNGGFRTEPGEHLIVDTLTGNGDAHSGFGDDKGLIAFDYCIGGSERTQIHRGNGYAQLQTRPDAIASSLIGVRRLTPVECERLQGFPDGWTEGQSDSVRYRQLGNAVAVPCARWLGKRIKRMAQ